MPTSRLPVLFERRLATCPLEALFRMLTELGDGVEIVLRPQKGRGYIRVLQTVAVGEPDELATERPRPTPSLLPSHAMPSGTAHDSDPLLDKCQVEELTSLDITTIYRKMKRGEFPQPLRVTSHRVAWRERDIRDWEDGLPVGTAKPPNPHGPKGKQWKEELLAAVAAADLNRVVNEVRPNPERDRPTIAALFEEYTKIAQQARSWPEQRRIFEKEVVPVWGERLVSEIQKRDIRELVLAKATTAPIMANRLLDRLSRLLSFAVELDWISSTPRTDFRRPPVNAAGIACCRATSCGSCGMRSRTVNRSPMYC
jgi:prophage regulatory protein